MMNSKKIISAVLAVSVAASSMCTFAGADNTTVKTEGYENTLNLEKIGSYISGHSNLDGGVAEIISYDKKNNKAWVVNGTTGMLDILDLNGVTCAESDVIPAVSLDIEKLAGSYVSEFAYGDMTSVSINSDLGLVAVALQDADYSKNGYASVLSTEGELIAMFEAGCQPDMITFTPDGTKILVANEGEPREGYGEGIVDPQGSVTVITLDTQEISASETQTIGFEVFDEKKDELIEDGVIFVKNALPSVDFEPEYIAADNDKAYIALQESNAIAVLDLETKEYDGVYSLGYKDLSLEENAIDLVEDGEYIKKTYENAVGAYMPDGISLYTANGKAYILTANEGDAREWGSDEAEYCNEIKETIIATDLTEAKKVRVIDPETTEGLPEGKVVLYGGRSFSIYEVSENGLTQVFDSNNHFEEKTAYYIPEFFNCSNDDNEYDSRSPKKGPEAESVVVGEVDGKTYAFVALERISGIMVYDITNPENAVFSNYINTRDFSENPEDADPSENPDFFLKGDIAPEGMYFISADDSPSGTAILLSAFEVSGTVSAFAVGEAPDGHKYENGICTSCGSQDPDYKEPENDASETLKPEDNKPTTPVKPVTPAIPDNKENASDDDDKVPDTGRNTGMLLTVFTLGTICVALSRKKSEE